MFSAGWGGECTTEPSDAQKHAAVRRASGLGVFAFVYWRRFLQGCEQSLRASRHLHGPLLKDDVRGAHLFAVQILVGVIVSA
jgi:hypothetical protein